MLRTVLLNTSNLMPLANTWKSQSGLITDSIRDNAKEANTSQGAPTKGTSNQTLARNNITETLYREYIAGL